MMNRSDSPFFASVARNQDDPAAQNRFRWKFYFSAENLKILPKKNFSSRKSKFPAERGNVQPEI